MLSLEQFIESVSRDLETSQATVRRSITMMLGFSREYLGSSFLRELLDKEPEFSFLIPETAPEGRPPGTISQGRLEAITDAVGATPDVSQRVHALLTESGLPGRSMAPFIRSFVLFLRNDLDIDFVQEVQGKTYDLTDVVREVIASLRAKGGSDG